MKFMEYNEFKDRDECVFDTEEANKTLEEHTSQLNNIANEDLIIKDGKLYIKKSDGTLKGTGVTLPSTSGSGSDGRGISNIEKTSTVGLIDTYTITYTDNTTSTFEVKNGVDGEEGIGIQSVTKTATNGLVDTYTITRTDGTIAGTFTVTNGATGSSDSLVSVQESDGVIQLTDDKYQYCSSISDSSEIYLPDMTSQFAEIHFFFSTESDLTLILPNCGWQNDAVPTISAYHVYEFIFTYVNDTWLGGVIEYGSQAIA